MCSAMDENYETVCLCALNDIFGYEPRVALALLENLGSARAVFGMTEEEKDAVFGPYGKHRGKICGKALDRAEGWLRSLRAEGASFIGFTSAEYPSRLKACADAPVGIYVRGDSPPGEMFGGGHYVAVVGTRDISPYGEQWCRDMVRTMADSGSAPCIVSGLAYGTDITAHRTALECGLPTLAVMATGTDRVYPARHSSFAGRLAHLPGCGLVSDYPPGTSPVPLNFLRRNRIIAGLSDCVIIVESDIRGGGMVTCRQAFSYDRPVFALPGRGDDRRSRGCNHLIKEGVAEIIESLDGLNLQLGLPSGGKTSPSGPVSGNRDRFSGGQDAVGESQCRLSGGQRAVTDASVSPGTDGAPGPCSGTGRARERLTERYSGMLPDERVRAMADILLKIREMRGIDLDGLCRETGLPYRNVSELTSLLENDGFISVDLLRRCSIR